MTGPQRQEVAFAEPGEVETTLTAVISFEPQSANVPYHREIAILRIHDPVGAAIPLGAYVRMCGASWRVVEALTRKLRNWTTMKVVCLRPEPRGIVIWSGQASFNERVVHTGLNAHDEDKERFKAQIVIAPARPTLDTGDKVREATEKLVAYMEHLPASVLRPGWSIHNGLHRYRVDAVADLGRIDVLPHASVTHTGFGV